MIEQTRAAYAAAWKAWKKANRIRRRLAALTGNRNGPGKAWADECRVVLSRAERAHRAALRDREEQKAALYRAILYAAQAPVRAPQWMNDPARWPN